MFRKFPCTFKMWWEKLDEFFPGQCVYISLLPKLFKRPKLTVGVKLLPAISASFLAHVPQCTKFLFVKIFLDRSNRGGRKEVKNSTPTVHANFQDWKFPISYIARSKERKLCFVTRIRKLVWVSSKHQKKICEALTTTGDFLWKDVKCFFGVLQTHWKPFRPISANLQLF